MKFAIKRLPSDDAARRYHLYDAADQLVLVADHGSPWLPNEPFRHVRFALPNGQPIASLDLPWLGELSRQDEATSYAVIFDHAVYALINAHVAEPRPFPYLIAEVEGHRWLVMPNGGNHHIYAGVPSGLAYCETPQELDLPEVIGTIAAATNPIAVELDPPPDDSLHETALFMLALTFLLDA